MIIVNMSVWEDFESLKFYVYQTVHSYFVRSSNKWFDKMEKPHMALWWVYPGHEPTVEEALQRLAMIEEDEVGPNAFFSVKPMGRMGSSCRNGVKRLACSRHLEGKIKNRKWKFQIFNPLYSTIPK